MRLTPTDLRSIMSRPAMAKANPTLPPMSAHEPNCDCVGEREEKPGMGGNSFKESEGSTLERKFLAMWNGPAPVREFVFAKPRRWRFDFAWPSRKVAVEIEGGVWSGGRHTRGGGFIGDCEKYNEACFCGWQVYRLVGKTIVPEVLERIKERLK